MESSVAAAGVRIERPLGRRRFWTAVSISGAVAVAALLVLPLIGSTSIDYSRAFAGLSPDHEILFATRLPRVLLALLAGGTLGVAGVLFQALLRDSLATPYTLGVSSGASLGAVVAICLGLHEIAHMSALWMCSFLGASLVLLVVVAVANEGRRMSSFTLLLAGVSINTICLAAILFLQYIANFGQTFAIVRWMMGGIDSVDYSTLGWFSLLILPSLFLIFLRARDWNLMAVGEEWALSRGVSVPRLMFTGYLLGSICTASITALTGPIAFVGLIVPHALRIRLGADHRVLLPCSFFCGAAFLALCDTIARTVLAPTEIPVGVVTALLGGPFFISLLRSRNRSLWL